MTRNKIKKIRNAEKIAAGEVIERPANIVKELVENSLDAGASEIRILVKKAGKHLIQVIDNGIGIPAEEIEVAFQRHTSSKIEGIEDLDNLQTLGFRGEALSSIAAVSKVIIISRTAEQAVGTKLSIEGGKTIENKEISCPIGTNISISNIFFNIPARQKFLKSDNTELGHITNFIQRFALANTHCHFIYRHNDIDILNCPASEDLKTTVFHIYGKKVAKGLIPFEFEDDSQTFSIRGLLGGPQISKKNRSDASLFLNGRYIISDLIFRAIKEAYKGILMIGRHPFFMIYMKLSPSVVDFNVHPKKLEVRFENDDYIYNKTYNVMRKFIEEFFIEKQIHVVETEIQDYFKRSEKKNTREKEPEDIPDIKELITESSNNLEIISNLEAKREDISKKSESMESKRVQLKLVDDYSDDKEKGNETETLIRESTITGKNFPKLKLISTTGQLSNKIYVVLEGENDEGDIGIYILDQHAASERINKEFFQGLDQDPKKQRQLLIAPLNIEVSPSERFFIKENLEEFHKMGFGLDHFGGNSFILREIPTIFGKIPKLDIVEDIISDIAKIGKDKSFSEVKEEIINYLACHQSIRGGDDLSLKDIKKLLVDLSKCTDSYHCAHGRPTLKFISFKELDKLFKRTG